MCLLVNRSMWHKSIGFVLSLQQCGEEKQHFAIVSCVQRHTKYSNCRLKCVHIYLVNYWMTNDDDNWYMHAIYQQVVFTHIIRTACTSTTTSHSTRTAIVVAAAMSTARYAIQHNTQPLPTLKSFGSVALDVSLLPAFVVCRVKRSSRRSTITHITRSNIFVS